MTTPADIALDAQSRALRAEILSILRESRRGHIGAAFSILEILRVLYTRVLRIDPAHPRDPQRDRFILSKGHGCLALYVMLAERGFFPQSDLRRFCQSGARLGGHPEYGPIPGVEFSTGSLGHGLPVAVGMALAARIDRRASRVFVLLGDGECNEGSVWEAALSAGKHRLEHLTVLVDANGMQSYGPTAEVQDLEPFADKWRSFGFGVAELNGHDAAALERALTAPPIMAGRPTALICRTVKGKGLRTAENNPRWHHKTAITDEELNAFLDELKGAGS